MNAMTNKLDAMTLLNRGIRNLWYPVTPSYMVKGDPFGITRLGDQIVLWRDTTGQVHALEDRCPHRGARLSLGWNIGDRVACWYHGIEVKGDGVVTAVPAVESCPLEGQKSVKSYPVRETNGAIWLWFGDEPHQEAGPFILPEEMTSPEFSGFLCTAFWRVNYRYAVDNVMDPMHGAYLHAVSHSMAEGEKTAKMRIRKTEHGFFFEKIGQMGVNFDWTEFGDTGNHWLRLAISYRKNAGPGGQFWICGWVTPVTEDVCQVYFWRIRQVTGWQRDAWRFMYRNRLEGRHGDVLEQDRMILETMPADAREHEFLYQHDTGMARLRRAMEDQAKAQVAALEQAKLASAAE